MYLLHTHTCLAFHILHTGTWRCSTTWTHAVGSLFVKLSALGKCGIIPSSLPKIQTCMTSLCLSLSSCSLSNTMSLTLLSLQLTSSCGGRQQWAARTVCGCTQAPQWAASPLTVCGCTQSRGMLQPEAHGAHAPSNRVMVRRNMAHTLLPCCPGLQECKNLP